MKRYQLIVILLTIVCSVLYLLSGPIFYFYEVYSSISFVPEIDINDIWLTALEDKKTHNYSNNFNSSLIHVSPIVHYLIPEEGIPMEWMKSYMTCKYKANRNGNFRSIMEWTDLSMRNFLLEHYPWFIKTYDSYPYHIQRIDSIRYFLLYHYGGIYLDLDVGCNLPLQFLLYLNSATLFAITKPLGVSNDFMIAQKHASFMHYVLLQLTKRNEDMEFLSTFSPYLTVMMSTGPLFLSHCIYEYMQLCRNRNTSQLLAQQQPLSLRGTASVKDLPPMEMIWSNDCSREIALLPHIDYTQILFFHVHGSSWHSIDGMVFTWIFFHFTHIAMWIVALGMCGGVWYIRRRKRSLT